MADRDPSPRLRTAHDWWQHTRDDPKALLAWLFDQYRGEVTAADRIDALRTRFAEAGTRAARVLRVIADQERQHAQWVGALLEARGHTPTVQPTPARYWPIVLTGIDSLTTGCAVGAHAERMRLERIEAIADDPTAPADIRACFARILPQERFHERAFRSLAGAEAMHATRDAHTQGRNALGLMP